MTNYETGSSRGLESDALLGKLLGELEASLAFSQAGGLPSSVLDWAKRLTLGPGPFKIEGHEYQVGVLEENAPRQCMKKGAQLGFTALALLKTLHGLITGRYKQGALILLPSENDVVDFSKGRLAPLLMDNRQIADRISSTDAAQVKRIGRSMLYLRGARPTGKIEGMQKTSSRLRSIPIDRVLFDEVDLMDFSMVAEALHRLDHSEIKEEVYLSTPSVPDFGIDKLYNESDQRIWLIRCEKCQGETCLELEFPNCLLETSDGRVIRACKKCHEEIFPKDGHWVAQYPERSKDMAGFWISQLNSAFVSPSSILKAFNDPPNRNLGQVYNSMLAMSYISAENRLTVADIYPCCGRELMAIKDPGPCAMGIDVGSVLHVVIGFRPTEKSLQLCKMIRLTSFDDLHELAARFNVKFCVIDAEPETRAARAFQQSEKFPVYLADYVDSVTGSRWDEEKKIVRINRTEILDEVHHLFSSPGRLILPRRGEEVDILAKHLTSLVKVLEEDAMGSRQYRYRAIAPDHYYHALGYFTLAAQRIPTSPTVPAEKLPPAKRAKLCADWKIFGPNPR